VVSNADFRFIREADPNRGHDSTHDAVKCIVDGGTCRPVHNTAARVQGDIRDSSPGTLARGGHKLVDGTEIDFTALRVVEEKHIGAVEVADRPARSAENARLTLTADP